MGADSSKRRDGRSNAENPIGKNPVKLRSMNASRLQTLRLKPCSMVGDACEVSMESLVTSFSERTDVSSDCENPVAVEQETVSLKEHSVMGHACENKPEGNKQKQSGFCHHGRQCWANGNPWKLRAIALSVALVISVAIIIYLSGKLLQVPAAPSPPEAMSPGPCPPHWVRDGSRCYYFSDTEATWNACQNHCSSQGGSLVTMETAQEQKFVLNSQHPPYYWLGLWRKEGKTWQRADGSLFNNTFLIGGDGFCAYMSEGKPSSTWCDNIRHWICTRPIRGH